MWALNQLNTSKEIKHAKNIQQSRVWKCWGHPSTQAPAVVGVRAGMAKGSTSPPTPFLWVDFFLTILHLHSSLQENAKG